MRESNVINQISTKITDDVELCYSLISTKLDQSVPELYEDIDTYGVSVKKICGEQEESIVIPDVSTSREFVEQLLLRLYSGRVTPITVPDVVEDSLAIMFM